MAIRDLLWACPICGREGGLVKARRAEVCDGCGTRFSRAAGSEITARRPDGDSETRPAAEWARRLPGIDLDARAVSEHDGSAVLHSEAVRARFAERLEPLRHRGTFLNRIERFGPYRNGTLFLEPNRLRLDHGAETTVWRFESIRAIQPSSSTLQINARGTPLVSFRFPNGSARFWEEIITEALRSHYRTHGLGEIAEFQPRIVTR